MPPQMTKRTLPKLEAVAYDRCGRGDHGALSLRRKLFSCNFPVVGSFQVEFSVHVVILSMAVGMYPFSLCRFLIDIFVFHGDVIIKRHY